MNKVSGSIEDISNQLSEWKIEIESIPLEVRWAIATVLLKDVSLTEEWYNTEDKKYKLMYNLLQDWVKQSMTQMRAKKAV